MQKLPLTLFSVGCAILVIAISLWKIINSAVRYSIAQEMSLQSGTLLREEWIKPKNETLLNIYIYNVTNPKKIEEGEDPLVVELGPYVYRERRFRRILEDKSQNGTLKYVDYVAYHFDEKLSTGTEGDVFVTPNVDLVMVSQYLATYAKLYRWFASVYHTKFLSKLFVEKTVRDFVFPGKLQPKNKEIEKFVKLFSLPISKAIMLQKRNATGTGIREINSGLSDLGSTISWNGRTELDFWEDDKCNEIKGGDGSLFPAFVTRDSTLNAFTPEFCRSVYFTYKNDLSVHGVPAYRFAPPTQFMESPENNPANSCFCKDEDKTKCPKDGVYQISACQNGAPIVMSFPHFLYGDQEYINKFRLSPKSDLHEYSIDLEPTTGTPLNIHKRLQLNVDIRRLPTIQKFQRIQDLMFPILWMDEHYMINGETANILRSGLVAPMMAIAITIYFAIAASIIILLTSLTVFWVRFMRKPVFV